MPNHLDSGWPARCKPDAFGWSGAARPREGTKPKLVYSPGVIQGTQHTWYDAHATRGPDCARVPKFLPK